MRLIVAFIVVALLGALASQWVIKLLLPVFPQLNHLRVLVDPPKWARPMFYVRPGGGGSMHLAFYLSFIFGLIAALLLLVVITGLAFAASRPVLLPVRRLARAAQRMADGDLSVRIQPRGRDELAQLVTSFNGMAAALEGKVGELERMEARARQFAGDVSHARLHGGHIDAGNHRDGGAIFAVSLPVNGRPVAVSDQMVQLTG